MSEVYEVIKLIGGGSFGQVYLVRHKREEKQYVIKKIKTREMSQKDRENTENEVRLLQKLRHTNIVAYKDSYLDREQYLNIVMVYCEGGDIYQKIKAAKGKHFPESQILDWLAQMALALYYLHDKKILHRDLKTQNIFLKNGRVRLGDFGIAKMLDSTRDFANTCIGTPYYMSPELFKYKPYSYKSDIWAFGCCVYEMCNLRHAFDAQSLNGLAVKIMKGSFAPISNVYSKSLRDLIGKMISTNPKNRPSIWDILNKPLIKNRIIPYVQELMSGTLGENTIIQDVDDVYLDSLKEQAKKLKIMAQIEKQINPNYTEIQAEKPTKQTRSEKEAQVKVNIQKKELLKEIREKRKIEEELRKLERKKQIQEIKNNQKNQIPSYQERQPKKVVNDNKASNPARRQAEHSQERGMANNKRSYSYERKRDSSLHQKSDNATEAKKSEVRKSYGQNPVSSKYNRKTPVSQSGISTRVDSRDDNNTNQDLDNDVGQISEISSVSSKPPKSNQVQNSNEIRRNQILQQKENKKKEEQKKWEQQFNQISQENAKNRQQAAQKKQAQFRSSNQQNQSMQNQNSRKSLQEDIPEVDIDNFNNDNQINDNQQLEENYNQKQQDHEGNDNYPIHEYQVEQQLQQVENQIQINQQKIEQQQQQQQPKSIQQNEQQQKQQVKIEEEYGMEDEQFYDEEGEEEDEEEAEEVIQEVENEEEYSDKEEENEQLIKSKIEQMKTKLMHKTQKINELQQSIKPNQQNILKEQTKYLEQDQISEDSEIEDNESNHDNDKEIEDDYDQEQGKLPEEAKLDYNPQYYKITDRIKLMKHRCEAGLGNVIFEQAYEFLKNCGDQRVDDVRREMLNILGEDMIGFWHLIDQILVLENMLQTIPQVLNPQIQK